MDAPGTGPGLLRINSERMDRKARIAVYLMFFLSGAAGLVYEVVWLRMLILVFGSTQFAVGTILTAFMGGLALGSFLFGRRIDRHGNPLRLYGLLELGIGLYALLIPLLFDLLVPVYTTIWNRFAPSFFTFSLIRFGFIMLVLIVPTSLMGGTLPILSKFVTRREDAIGMSVGTLYAINTFGAVVGTAAAGFFLIAAFGSRATLLTAAAINLVIGLFSLLLSRGREPAEAAHVSTVPEPLEDRPAIPRDARLLLLIVGGTGFVAMIYEIAWTRVLALIIGSSVYAFTIMLTTFLVGLALGAAVVAGLADRVRGRYAIELLIGLLAGTAVAAFGTLLTFNQLPYYFTRLYHLVRGNQPLIFAIEFLIAFVVMLLPTLLIGGIFPLVLRHCSERISRLGRSVGSVYASNTVGTILGSFLAGFFLIPLVGIQGSILLAISLDLLLAAILVIGATGGLRRLTGWSLPLRLGGVAVLVLLGVGLNLASPSWNTLVMNSGVYQYAEGFEKDQLTPEGFMEFAVGDFDLLFYEEGMTVSVMVVYQDSADSYFLAVNGKIDASSSGDMPTQLLSGHLPVLLTQDASNALVIGYASGITVGAVTRHALEEITAVEIEPAILRGSRYFNAFNNKPMEDPRVRIIKNDGRNYLLVNDEKYDVIISEPSNPWMTVAANLFTREFFELGASRLKPGGVFTQWLQMYGMSTEDLKVLLRTFRSVFPHVLVFNTIDRADLVLVGARHPLSFDLGELKSRMSELSVGVDLRRIKVETPQDLLSYFVFGDKELDSLLGEGPINTDDNALIEFRAPKSLTMETRDANMDVIRAVTVDPTLYVTGLDDPARRREHQIEMTRAFLRRNLYDRAAASSRAAADPGS